MKLKLIFCFVFAALIHSSSFGQKQNTNKMIIGTWEYDIAYDTIAMAATNTIPDTASMYPMFLTLRIKEKEAVLFDISKKTKAAWDVNESSQIRFVLKDGRVLKYAITSLTSNSLELKELSAQGSILGYKKR